MEKDKKTVRFVGGPLDGKTKEIDQELTTYEVDQPAAPEDLEEGDLPIGFFPPFHKYRYEEDANDSGVFHYKQDSGS